jgi:uncharacterized protein (TIGR00297 family)
MLFTAKAEKLTLNASLVGGLLSFIILFCVGYLGVVLLSVFFLLGTVATFWGYREKRSKGISEGNNGIRGATQVMANAGAAASLALLAWVFPDYSDLFLLMIACVFSSAAADTLSSEMGNLHGRRFFNVLTGKPDQKGFDGVISLEGTLWGVFGSTVIAFIYSLGVGFGTHFFIIIIAGTIGNLADSVLGASLERKQVLNNDMVNFLNTVIAALISLLLI